MITSITPSSEPLVNSGFVLTINGSGFQVNSVVHINGVTYLPLFSATQLIVSLPALAFSSAGELMVTVTNPTPGGGTSNGASLEIDNPVPSIVWISPVQAYAGSGDTMLTVRGANLNSSSELEWNGLLLQNATFTSIAGAQFLQATVPAADLVTAGSPVIAVVNPGPGGGTASKTLMVLVHPPEIDSLSPGFTAPGGGDFTLTVTGVDFDTSATVYWNGNALATTFVSPAELQVTVPAADILGAGVASITVVNPDAAGGTSVPASFAIDASGSAVLTIAQPVNDIEWDPTNFVFYGSTRASDPNYPLSIISVDPVVADVIASANISFEGHLLALSKDDKMMYVSFPGFLERFTLPGFVFDENLFLGFTSFGQDSASALQVSPLYSHVVAATSMRPGLTPANLGAVVYDDSSMVSYSSPNETWDAMSWSLDGNNVYAGDTEDSQKSFMTDTYSVVAPSVPTIQFTQSLWVGGPMHVDSPSGLVYADHSFNVIDPLAKSIRAAFPISGVMVPDSSLGCAYFIVQTPAQVGTTDYTLSCYSTTDQTLTRSLVISAVNGAPTKLMRWGNEGLAFITDAGSIYFVSGQIVTGN